MKTTYTQDLKIAIAAEFVNNKNVNVKDVVSKYNVSKSSVNRWKVAYLEQAKARKEQTNRGFKTRNGRVSIIENVLSSIDLTNTKTKDQYIQAFEACKENGLADLTYGTFITLRRNYLNKNKA